MHSVVNWPKRKEGFEGRLLSPFLHQLMRATNELELVQMVEFVDNFGAKKPSRASRADLPCVDVLGV